MSPAALRLLPLLLLAGCAVPECRSGQPMLRAELFFGRSLPGGGEVDEAAWQDFLRQAATPRFPDGLTVVDAAGQWRDPAGRVVRERSKVLVAVVPDTAAAVGALYAVAADYRARFSQQSIGIATMPVCAQF